MDESKIDFDQLPPLPKPGSSWRAEWWIAFGHLRGRNEVLISLVAFLAIGGVVLGVAAVNIVVAVMAGFQIDLRDKILGANAHAVVLTMEPPMRDYEAVLTRLEAMPEIEAAAPFIYTEVMIRSPQSVSGIILKGIDPKRTGGVTSLQDELAWSSAGSLQTAEQRQQLFNSLGELFPAPGKEIGDVEADPLPGIFIGEKLREQLKTSPGEVVQVIDPIGGGSGPMGVPTPKVRRFRVAGVFDTGMYEYDTKWTYITNSEAQIFLGLENAVTGIELQATDLDRVEELSVQIQQTLGYPYYTRHWKELNRDLFEALELEKVVMGLILFIIVVVAAALIISTLVMTVITKSREIAILKAMGASKLAILRVFIIEGTLIGIVGTGLGTVLGLGGCAFLDWYGYPLKTDVYFLSELPVVVETTHVVTIALATIVVCFFATIYPAYQAAMLDPIEGLRHE